MDKFLEEREEMLVKYKHIDYLLKKHKNNFPNDISPIWDLSPYSINHNNFKQSLIDSGLSIYVAKFSDFWSGLVNPNAYSKDTLWDNNSHNDWKIAQVIEHWENKEKLSPIYLVKHGSKNLAVVADGKHRLTVSHYCLDGSNESFPFLVETDNCEWLHQAIPTAKKI